MTTDNEDIDNELEDTLPVDDGEGEDTLPADDGEDEESEDSTEGGEDTVEGGDQKQAVDAHKGRGSSRIAALAKRAKEAEERAIRAETLAEERAANRTAASIGGDTATAQRLREEKLALMDPTERKDFLREERIQKMEEGILLTQLRTADQLDHGSYQAKAANNPVYSRHADEVEKRLRSERQQGRNWSREQILAQVVGERALQAKPDTKKKNEAKDRVERTRAPAPRTRSDAGSTSYRPGKAGESLDELERRLENVTF